MFWINNIRTRCHLVKRQNLFATHEAIGTGNYKIYHEAIIVVDVYFYVFVVLINEEFDFLKC